MRLFLYYAVHTFKNQLKKIFKSWVIVFILACALFGGIFGFVGGMIGEYASQQSEEDFIIEEDGDTPAEETEALPSDKEDASDDEFSIDFSFTTEGLSKNAVMELIIGAVILLILALEALSADKSGAKIFQPADVNLLFASPMKPQAVLMFRLVTKMGLMLFLTLYMFIEMPTLTHNVGLSVPAAVSVIIAWGLLLTFSMLLQAFLYIYAASHENRKSAITYTVYGLLSLIVVGFLAYYMTSGQKFLPALDGYFNAPVTRFIPVAGWIKGLCMYMAEANYPMAGLMLGLTLLASFGLLFVISRMKADFYEDAMAKSEETAQLLADAKESGGLAVRKRKKDRSETLLRDGMNRGEGANVFFWKTVYNRKRFSTLGYFTKTTFTYLALAGLTALILFTAAKNVGFERYNIVALVLTAAVFYRSLGNPLDQDVKVDYFRMIPESRYQKMFFSLLGGSYNCLLDLLPGLLIAALLLRPPVYPALIWLVFLVSMDAYSTTVITFIELAVPKHSAKMVKQFIQIIFLYFGLGPAAALIAVGWILGFLPAMLLIAAALNFGLAAFFIMLSAVRI